MIGSEKDPYFDLWELWDILSSRKPAVFFIISCLLLVQDGGRTQLVQFNSVRFLYCSIAFCQEWVGYLDRRRHRNRSCLLRQLCSSLDWNKLNHCVHFTSKRSWFKLKVSHLMKFWKNFKINASAILGKLWWWSFLDMSTTRIKYYHNTARCYCSKIYVTMERKKEGSN